MCVCVCVFLIWMYLLRYHPIWLVIISRLDLNIIIICINIIFIFKYFIIEYKCIYYINILYF